MLPLIASARCAVNHACRFAYLERLEALDDKGRRREPAAPAGGGHVPSALSVAQTANVSAWALSDKALEATVCLRFLRTQRNRLKVGIRLWKLTAEWKVIEMQARFGFFLTLMISSDLAVSTFHDGLDVAIAMKVALPVRPALSPGRVQVLHYINAMVSMQLSLLRDERREEAAGSSSRLTTVSIKEFTCPLRLAVSSGPGGSGDVAPEEGSFGSAEDGSCWPDDFLEDDEAGVMVRDQSGR